MTTHVVGASSTSDWTQNGYQNLTATVNDTSSLTGSFSAGDGFTWNNDGQTILVLYVTTSGTGTIDALASGNNVSLTLTATGTYVLGPLNPATFGSAVTITTATAVGKYQTFACVGTFGNPLHNPFEATATAVDH